MTKKEMVYNYIKENRDCLKKHANYNELTEYLIEKLRIYIGKDTVYQVVRKHFSDFKGEQTNIKKMSNKVIYREIYNNRETECTSIIKGDGGTIDRILDKKRKEKGCSIIIDSITPI